MAHPRRFTPGTTGWTVEDLDDPRINRRWERGGYEIVEGVLTKMPAAYLEGSLPLRRLARQIERHLEDNGLPGEFAFEVDLVVNRIRVPRVDAVFLTAEQIEMQAAIEATRKKRRGQVRYGRLRVAPTLIIESISIGHELHDRQTKYEWYRRFGVAHYWLLNPFARTLECLRLVENSYVTDAEGHDAMEITPTLFPGLTIHLDRIWI
jgi:Uma2 family endonuclease